MYLKKTIRSFCSTSIKKRYKFKLKPVILKRNIQIVSNLFQKPVTNTIIYNFGTHVITRPTNIFKYPVNNVKRFIDI